MGLEPALQQRWGQIRFLVLFKERVRSDFSLVLTQKTDLTLSTGLNKAKCTWPLPADCLRLINTGGKYAGTLQQH